MRNIIRTVLTAFAVLITTLALTASAVPATWTATPGGAITAYNIGPVNTADMTHFTVLVCSESTATGILKSGSGLVGAEIAKLESVTFTSPSNPNSWCTASGGLPCEITTSASPTNPWYFNAESYDSSTGVTSGNLSGVSGSIHCFDGCDATFGGAGDDSNTATIDGTFTNSTDRLEVTGKNIVVQTVDVQCSPVLITENDPIMIQAKYQLTSDQTISSP